VHTTIRHVDPAAEVILCGRLDDGNEHPNVSVPAPDDGRVDGSVLGLVGRPGGRIGRGRGIGPALGSRDRGDAEVQGLGRPGAGF
jgi:hypothetical protein